MRMCTLICGLPPVGAHKKYARIHIDFYDQIDNCCNIIRWTLLTEAKKKKSNLQKHNLVLRWPMADSRLNHCCAASGKCCGPNALNAEASKGGLNEEANDKMWSANTMLSNSLQLLPETMKIYTCSMAGVHFHEHVDGLSLRRVG